MSNVDIRNRKWYARSHLTIWDDNFTQFSSRFEAGREASLVPEGYPSVYPPTSLMEPE